MEQQNPEITEDNLLDYIFHTLYINLDKNEMHFENEIIAATNITITQKEIEHIREICLSTGFIKASVGFGKSGFMYLTSNGIQLMKLYETYSSYISTLPAHKPQTNVQEITQSNTNKTITTNTNHFLDEDLAI